MWLLFLREKADLITFVCELIDVELKYVILNNSSFRIELGKFY